jgi:rhamnosyltransferase
MMVLPIYHPDHRLIQLLESINRQKEVIFGLYIIDSGSSISYVLHIHEHIPFFIRHIDSSTFNHGGTRQKSVEECFKSEFIIFMTQDAVLENDLSLHNLLQAFQDDQVGAAYGRQIPNPDAYCLAAHARLYNYSEKSHIQQISDVPKLGIKVAFMSNSFAAYRRKALMSVGGFPVHVILGEDTYVAAKMILEKWKISYRADAKVYHSHNYSIFEECRRYFDTGVFHGKEPWMEKSFGHVNHEGVRFLQSQLRYIWKYDPRMIFQALIRDVLDFFFFQAGKRENLLPQFIKIKMSMTKKYWHR